MIPNLQELDRLKEEAARLVAAYDQVYAAIEAEGPCVYEAAICWCHPDDSNYCRPSMCGGIPIGTESEVPMVPPRVGP